MNKWKDTAQSIAFPLTLSHRGGGFQVLGSGPGQGQGDFLLACYSTRSMLYTYFIV